LKIDKKNLHYIKKYKGDFFMKSVSPIFLALSFLLLSFPCIGKKEKPQYNVSQKNDILNEYEEEFKEPQGYQPNPVILDGVGQIMNGALSIAQNPHSRPNIGHSVAAMIYGIMKIIVEKVAHKKMNPEHLKALEECCDEICADMSKEITEIIVTKNYMIS
jgi:hypothetical protein